MTLQDCIDKLMKIDSLEFATVDERGLPRLRVISARVFEGETMYFLTARGKAFARQLEKNPHIAAIGFDEAANDMVRITGRAERVPDGEQTAKRNLIYAVYPYLENVYPGETKEIDVVYRLARYAVEYFTLRTRPITRESFEVNGAEREKKGYRITDACIQCGACQSVCPQRVIAAGTPFVIDEAHCLHCGGCFEACPVQAVEWLGEPL